jgi:hypothetical protein
MVTCQTNVANIAKNLEYYANKHQGNYPDKLSDLVPDYIDKIPLCTAVKKDSYSSSYTVFNDPKSNMHKYTFYCNGENHKRIISGNYPQYNSTWGLVTK